MDEYFHLRAGFMNKRRYEQEVLRNAVGIIISPWLKNAPNMRQIWPLSGEENKKVSNHAEKLLKFHRDNDGKFKYIKIDNKIVMVPDKPNEN